MKITLSRGEQEMIASYMDLAVSAQSFDHPFGNFLAGMAVGMRLILGRECFKGIFKILQETNNKDAIGPIVTGVYLFKEYYELRKHWEGIPQETKDWVNRFIQKTIDLAKKTYNLEKENKEN